MNDILESRLPRASYMKCPFRLGPKGPETSTRMDHIREQVEQVLFIIDQVQLFLRRYGLPADLKDLDQPEDEHQQLQDEEEEQD